MNIESKFLFISRFFVLLFFIINLTYLIPFNIFETSYYFNSSTAIVDTSTLLILGLAVPKFIYLKRIQKYKDSNNSNLDYSEEIDAINIKNFYNSKIAYFLSIFFLILALIQQLNIIFTLNKNEIYTCSMVQQFNNSLKNNATKQEIQKDKVTAPKSGSSALANAFGGQQKPPKRVVVQQPPAPAIRQSSAPPTFTNS